MSTETYSDAYQPSSIASQPSCKAFQPSSDASQPGLDASQGSRKASYRKSDAFQPSSNAPHPSCDAPPHSSEVSPPNADASHPNAGRVRSIICTCFVLSVRSAQPLTSKLFSLASKTTKCNPPVKSKQSTLHLFHYFRWCFLLPFSFELDSTFVGAFPDGPGGGSCRCSCCWCSCSSTASASALEVQPRPASKRSNITTNSAVSSPVSGLLQFDVVCCAGF